MTLVRTFSWSPYGCSVGYALNSPVFCFFRTCDFMLLGGMYGDVCYISPCSTKLPARSSSAGNDISMVSDGDL